MQLGLRMPGKFIDNIPCAAASVYLAVFALFLQELALSGQAFLNNEINHILKVSFHQRGEVRIMKL